MARTTSGLMRCFERVFAGLDSYESCNTRATETLSRRFETVEERGDCEGTAGAAVMSWQIGVVLLPVFEGLGLLGPDHPACDATRLEKARVFLHCILASEARYSNRPKGFRLFFRQDTCAATFTAAIRQPPCEINFANQGLFEIGSAIRALRAALGSVCGDGIRTGAETCDRIDDASCPGRCTSDCRCGPACGDGMVNRPGEQCDGSDDGACPGACRANCTCTGTSCGDGITQAGEECDGPTGEEYSCGEPSGPVACRICFSDGGMRLNAIVPCCDGSGCWPLDSVSCACFPYE